MTLILRPSCQCSFYWNISNLRLCVCENDMVACVESFLALSLKFVFPLIFPSFSSVYFKNRDFVPFIHLSANTSFSLNCQVRCAATVSSGLSQNCSLF